MAQQAITAVLVVNPDPEWIYKAADRPDDGVCFFILYQTGLHRDYPVSAFFVNARDNLSVMLPGKGRMHLVPVMVRFLHPHDGAHRTNV